ncbi:RNA methyltransferase [Fulvivirga sp. 29W222]|uniref:RNA methyltransferase n=1 Tax=Fulvivirga marina TaxID=2494733 RepID=A0A937G2E9_9BACT|nr:RNA methyltransferase [Fulvivirga marina]MBL6449437.1 RNA methyltransferase [Fulvivirga marina]
MVSKSNAKFIKSLQLKKYRKQEQCFLVEGAKSVLEVLNSDYELKQLIATEQFINGHTSLLSHQLEIIETSAKQLASLGTLKTNDAAIAVVNMKPQREIRLQPDEWAIALDDINDPGNLGTILRIADWYGIDTVLASAQTADFYNPKVIAASKGSFCRVNIYYADLPEFLSKSQLCIYGAAMEGGDVHNSSFEKGGILVMGNEANGISADVLRCLTKKITIPRYGKAESLNVAMATAIICDNIRRSQ